ncbi:hypothetical protein Y013_22460 [Rhodococcus pyridinivorans SB3094]|uniref:Uncharacterized protein n=1 Tax=Rhodococcus pyridinivorans SB3094 TaxID=1435356 RepID=V9XNF3_9NOCA|nr:hypothetical protein Y013_22460 [Rhodococcus pyridinivorans SB3094]
MDAFVFMKSRCIMSRISSAAMTLAYALAPRNRPPHSRPARWMNVIGP